MIALLLVLLLMLAADADRPAAQDRDGSEVRSRNPAALCRADPMSADPSSAPKVTATIAQLEWLSGVWVGSSGSEERWTPPASGSMFAVARTMRGGVMT